MSDVISKCGVHCIGSDRHGYGPFLQRIAESGRRLSLVKCRDDFGAIDEPVQLWPEIVTIGAHHIWDDADYSVDTAYDRIVEAAAVNPKIKYWEYYNERNGDYAQQADLYIALLPRLASLGIGLCLFNCASGTPQYPAIDEAPYREIARACAFAVANGYKAILGLHEYWTPSDTIGRYKVLADYLSAHGALLPIAITEYGYETNPGNAAYMQFVKANDPLYMADPRVIGCALWTLGGGGWGASNYDTMLPELGEYIATVSPLTPPPSITKGGLHLSANGNHADDPSLPLEIQAMKTAKLTRCKFMSNGDPEFVHVLQANSIDLANSVCRLYAAGDNAVLKDPARFYLEQRAYITEVHGHGVRLFEIHNEPNLTNEGYNFAWNTPDEFATNFYAPVARLIRENFPDIKLVYPGLAPRPDWAAWKPSIASLIGQGLIDLIGVHCYWDSAINMRSAEQGRTFERFADMGRNLIITEASHNINNVPDAQKGAEYAEYITALPSYVADCFFFVSYGPAYDGSGETWVRGDPPALTAIPAAVGMAIPVGEREFDHWLDMDTGAILGMVNPLTFTLTGNRNIRAITRPKVIMFTCLTSADSGSVTGGGTYPINTMITLEWLEQ